MPKTRKKFDWEVYDEEGNFLDIISMTRTEIKAYKSNNLNYIIREIGYSDDEE